MTMFPDGLSPISAGSIWPRLLRRHRDRARAAVQRRDLEPHPSTGHGHAPYDIRDNGRPLVFYHFSGFDSGAQQSMLDLYGAQPGALRFARLVHRTVRGAGQSTLGKIDACTTRSRTASGQDAHRLVYRQREDLMLRFPNPFETNESRRSYYRWFELHGPPKGCVRWSSC